MWNFSEQFFLEQLLVNVSVSWVGLAPPFQNNKYLIWLTKQINTPSQVSELFTEIAFPKEKVEICLWWSTILIKSHIKFAEVGFHIFNFVRFSVSFCRAHANAFFCSWDVFLGSLIKSQTSNISSDNEWQRVVYNEWYLMTMSGTTIDNEWQQVMQRVTANENEWSSQFKFFLPAIPSN